MLQRHRSEKRQIVYRLAVFLISSFVIGYALAASEPKESVSDASRQRSPATEEKKEKEKPDPPVFIPSEKVSADKSVSFPTDI